MSERDLRVLTKRALRFLKLKKTSVDVFLVSEKSMKFLSRRFLGKRTPTNVLSFEEPNGFPSRKGWKHLGEVYLCPSYIKRKGEDIKFMVFHGILHLLGYNHETKGDRMRMQKREMEFLSWLGSKS
ncbi:MAG: rRNA maturation RNase YbeY [Candidatus Colwellbacteria bacterium]|nr:rRNA maturation RNase YbeY [Candidatus Colwellbacteria bacterium]